METIELSLSLSECIYEHIKDTFLLSLTAAGGHNDMVFLVTLNWSSIKLLGTLTQPNCVLKVERNIEFGADRKDLKN